MYKYLDYLFLPTSLWIATVYRFHYTVFELRELYLLFSALIAWTVATTLFKVYTKENTLNIFTSRLPATITFFFLMTGMSFYAHNELDFSRVVLMLFTSLQFLLPLLVKQGIILIFNPKNHPSHYASLVIGEGALYESTLKEYRSKKKSFSTLSFEEASAKNPAAVISNFEKEIDLQEIILITSVQQKAYTDSVIKAAQNRGIRVQLFIDNKEFTSFPVKAETIGTVTHYRPLSNRLENRDSRILKRLFDLSVAVIITLLISPLLFAIAILLKLSSPKEKVLFTQKRMGYNQKQFECFKFRSMKTVSQDVADKIQATASDPRITKLGSFLRKSNLDELPQLFNVIRGDMSLVGPRPHPVIMNDHKKDVPEYLLRHFVIPGMTGWAQVNGYRGPTDTEEKIRGRVEHDLWYIEHWSIWLDMKIMFLTVFSRKVYENAF